MDIVQMIDQTLLTNDADEQTLVAAMLEGLPEGSGSCSYIVNQSKNAVIMTFGDRKKAST